MAMLNNQRVNPINIPLNHYKIPLNHYMYTYIGHTVDQWRQLWCHWTPPRSDLPAFFQHLAGMPREAKFFWGTRPGKHTKSY